MTLLQVIANVGGITFLLTIFALSLAHIMSRHDAENYLVALLYSGPVGMEDKISARPSPLNCMATVLCCRPCRLRLLGRRQKLLELGRQRLAEESDVVLLLHSLRMVRRFMADSIPDDHLRQMQLSTIPVTLELTAKPK